MPVLDDWQALDVPPVNLRYRPSVRRLPRMRLVIMERFDPGAPRAPREWPAGAPSIDSCGAARDPRLGATGSIAAIATEPVG